MKFVVLEKAHVKGFLRTRLGRIERVNPYDRRPIPRKVLAALVKQFNLSDITIETTDAPKRYALKVLLDHLGKLADKVTIDGRNELKLVVQDVVSIDGTIAGALWNPNETAIYIGNEYQETLAHEYGHFMLEHNIWNNVVYQEGWTRWINLEKQIIFGDTNIGQFKTDFPKVYIGQVNSEYMDTPEKIAVKELLVNLLGFYETKLDLMYGKIKKLRGRNYTYSNLDYFFNPSEVFARAINAYVEPFPEGEKKWSKYTDIENGEYYKIVNEWGNKYLKTGLVKGQSYFRTREGKWEHVKGYTRHGITKKCIACGNEYGFIKEPKEKDAITAGICPTCFTRIKFQRQVTTA